MNRIRERYISIAEMNVRLTIVKLTRKIEHRDVTRREHVVGYNAFIDDRQTYFRLTYKEGTEVTTYVCRKDSGEHVEQQANGGEAYRILNIYYKVPKITANFSASPFTYVNEKYDNTRNYCYYYDLNSAYASIMVNYDFPDTSIKPVAKVIEDNEIGFDANGDIVETGNFAYFVFPKMKSPFKKFANVWYQKKQNAIYEDDRVRAKNVLCYSVGILQNKNTFLRAYIVNSCNEYIKSLIDENTVYCNTDCIVSLKPKNELIIGTEIGQWKYKEGLFACKGFSYQWNLDKPSYKGIPKGWFKPGWDILKDDIPHNGNVYDYNPLTNKLEASIYEMD